MILAPALITLNLETVHRSSSTLLNFQQYSHVCGGSIGYSMVEMHQGNLLDDNWAYTIMMD